MYRIGRVAGFTAAAFSLGIFLGGTGHITTTTLATALDYGAVGQL
jgi:hypothetical protein